ncbi:Macrolide export protein MacA [Rubripirellula amarantea]|uniref:Macrolide export protein MacA n=1 Tax=Rubripirellula amarantea TaxID=2527999 RepID=A0A5C5WEW1_9BACT|nr:HlyD family efflux transporter periplasmic adaptor subunit [Rubripirellula amarantea]TWT49284.1 Macrolide export protein MacA [Rubripirellula amarantea]
MNYLLRATLRLALVATVAIAGYFGWQWWLAQQPAPLPEGIVFGNGRIEAVQVDISTKYAGRVEKVLAREGDLVERGQLLVQMDTLELQATLAQAKAQFAEAEQAITQAEAVLLERDSQLQLAKRDLERAAKLLPQRAISQEEYDQKKSQREVASASLAAAKASVNTARRSADASKAAVNRIEVQIADAQLKAPTKGRVLYRLAEEGEVVSAGGKVLTLMDLSDIYMEIFLPAKQATQLSIGADARIVLDVAPGYAGVAKVTFVSPEAQFTPKQVETQEERDKLMFRVKIQVPQEQVVKHIEKIKSGIRGVAYVKIDDTVDWPEQLDRLFPDDLSQMHFDR